jgi:acyl-CoA reductase-like NAD-dependent aldehyde dehydrogenase
MLKTAERNRKMFVDGKWIDALDGKTYERRTPYDGELVGVYPDADVADVDLAIGVARRAFDYQKGWRYTSAGDRAAVLKRASELMLENIDTLRSTLIEEVGQPKQEGRVTWSAETLDYYSYLIRDRRDDAVTEQRFDALGIIAREPVGVVGALTAWNSPLSIAHKACAALAAGCTLVVKPAHYTAGAIIQFAEIMQEAGLPDGVLNVVTSQRENGAVVGQAISASHDVDMLTFTGSTFTARKIMATAAGSIKRLNLELGGKSPHVVCADVKDMRAAASAAARGVMGLTGQSCQAGTRLLLQESIKDEFLALLMEEFAAVRLGDPFDPATTAGPLVSEEQLGRVSAYVETGKSEAKLILGGGRPEGSQFDRGFFFEPTIFDDVSPSARIAQEEIFGPVLSILTFTDIDDAIRIANDTIYGLAAAVWTNDINDALRFAKRIRAGIVWVNGYRDTSVLKGMPMGGYKGSGIGREHGREGLDAFLETKSIMINLAQG